VSVAIHEADLQFKVYGMPVAQGSKKVIRGHLIEMADARLRTWRQDVAGAASEAMAGTLPYSEPVSLRLNFFLPRPRGHFGSGKNKEKLKPSAPEFPGVHPDLDKLARSVLDALTHIAFHDDKQVVMLTLAKFYADEDFRPGMMAGMTVLR